MLYRYRNYVISILFGIVCLLYVVYIIVGVFVSTAGYELAEYQRKINELRAENMRLYEELLTTQSLTHIRKKAKAMGFIDAYPNRIYRLR